MQAIADDTGVKEMSLSEQAAWCLTNHRALYKASFPTIGLDDDDATCRFICRCAGDAIILVEHYITWARHISPHIEAGKSITWGLRYHYEYDRNIQKLSVLSVISQIMGKSNEGNAAIRSIIRDILKKPGLMPLNSDISDT